MQRLKRMVIAVSISLMAAGAWANNFKAADQVYLAAMARIPINATSIFKTDVVISNLTNVAVRVDVALSEGTGGTPNAVSDANLRLVRVLQPFERVEISDFVQSVLGRAQAFGQAIFFACREGGDCRNCEANDADCRNISVEARIYTENSAGCLNNSPICTVGQLFSGVPFYNYASIEEQASNLHRVFIVGLREFGTRATGTSPGSGFRSNIGAINASNTTSTTLLLRLFRNESPAVQFGEARVTLGPLGHTQGNVAGLFAGFTGSGFVTVEQESFTPLPGETDAVPGFIVYGSILDNVTNDATTLAPQFYEPLDYACVYGAKPEKRLIKR
ncbi:MAG TPA: hypothetical protein VMT00_15250 [Thermoanaerobaculia bacterium]|nr:hypothetical protein [Thermoanaerobaculia bacterium]